MNACFPIRSYRGSDRPFVIKSWVTCMRSQYPFSKMSSDAIRKYSQRVEALIDVARVIICCDPVNDDVIYGFMAYETEEYLCRDSPTVHMIWVRKKFRRLGMGTHLLRTIFPEGMDLIYTHHTKDLNHGNLEEKWSLKYYDPYFIEAALYDRANKLDARAIYRSELTNPLSVAS